MAILLFINFSVFLLISVMLNSNTWQAATLQVATIILTIANCAALLVSIGAVAAVLAAVGF